jgi:L-amino acid N-acyltransferase YncA
MTWWVYEENQKILAYAFAAPWKPRSAYKNTVEVSIYVDKDQHSKGIGLALYSHLLETVRQENFHAVLAGIALPNEQSVKFHQKLGFKKVGQLREVGFKFNRWIDVSYWELLF